ncbi:MAG: TOBE domain-containing protein [Pseudonocardia sp.]
MGVGTFVGEAVVLPATVRNGRAVTALSALPVGGSVADGVGTVLLRPEQLKLSVSNGAPVRATVVEVVFHGHDTTVLLDVDGVPVRCRTAEPVAPEVGERVDVRVDGAARFYPSGRPGSTRDRTSPRRARCVVEGTLPLVALEARRRLLHSAYTLLRLAGTLLGAGRGPCGGGSHVFMLSFSRS